MSINFSPVEVVTASKLVSAGIAMGFGAIGSGIGEGYTAQEACSGIARQNSQQNPLLKNMLVGQAVAETPGIFALVMCFMLILAKPSEPETMMMAIIQSMALLGCGISVGVSGIGTGVGAGLVGGQACRSLARQPEVVGKMLMTMLIGQALSSTPSIFGFVIALLLMYAKGTTIVQGFAFLGAGIAMGAGAIGPALGIGYVGGETCKGMAKNIKVSSMLTRTMFIGVAVTESTSIYSLVIALLLLYSV